MSAGAVDSEVLSMLGRPPLGHFGMRRRRRMFGGRQMRLETLRLREAVATAGLLLQAVIIPKGNTPDGQLVEAVALPWFTIISKILEEPARIFDLDWRKWEELIAGAYAQDGWDVVLTPRTNDKGRDIIASSQKLGKIRIVDQVKAYRPGHVVTAEEVRAMIGVLTLDQNVSKGLITTTSTFAPGIFRDADIARLMPYRLELKSRDELVQWLTSIARRPTKP
jgi:restriction system protein